MKKGMILNKKYILVIVFALFGIISFAQNNLSMYYMEKIPQSRYSNPGMISPYRYYFSFPMLSSINVSFSNSFKMTDVIKHRSIDDSLYIDKSFIDKLKDNNFASVEYKHELISFGFKIKSNYFSFNVNENVGLRFNYAKDLFNLILNGNTPSINNEFNLDGMGLNFIHYREYGLGYAREINDKLSVGAKLKYLYGGMNIYTEQSDISFTTDEEAYYLNMQAKYKINTSIPEEFDFADYMFKNKNKGFAFDIGANYKINDKFSVSGSLIDFGSIKWKSNVYNYESTGENVQFSGLDFNDLFSKDPTADNFGELLDSLQNSFIAEETENSYRSPLPKKIFIGTAYALTEKINLGFLYRNEIVNKKSNSAIAFSYNQELGKVFSFTGSYSIFNRTYTNIGLGFALNLGGFQFYAMTDNVFGIDILNSRNANVIFGFNFAFHKKEEKEKKYVPISTDIKK
ncbi:MAG: hypothetical protein A2X12_02945 [Bacteroidetes bacterium GWE2_29_8]|nr:MAG: hypothetical protein A2X12_02945 [Bacteroidetes bacterium GWE2_29_8]OFY15371.1 MAG: hypothetical protein A2X02_02960 [Bacteroidetes bacterium GWF2_29_10]